MLIPAHATHKANAERLMNFYYQLRIVAGLPGADRFRTHPM